MKIVSYLDITFNLNDENYKPSSNPNTKTKYIDKYSNHPPSAIHQIPLSIESRLSTVYFNEKIFQEAAPLTKNHYKIVAISINLPINTLKTITTEQNSTK